MFGKKRCPNCNRKIEKKFDFCPYCAAQLRNPKDYGLLGKNDEDNFDKEFQNQSPFGSMGFGGVMGGGFFNKVLESTFKTLEKEVIKMNEEDIKAEKMRMHKAPILSRGNFQLFINGKRIPLPNDIQYTDSKEEVSKQKIQRQKIPKVSQELIQKSAKLPRKEAKASLTRLKDKIIYELEIPGLNSLDKVLINKLENSIEIKVFTDKAVYNKTLQLKLPLIQYSIPQEGKLILEFRA